MKYARIRISKDCEISVSVPRSYTAAEIKNNIDTPTLEVQKKNPDSLYNYYKKWIALRNGNEALKYGDLQIVNVNDSQILAYKRTYKNKSVIVLHNLSNTEKNVNVDGKNIKISGLTSVLVSTI